METAVSVSLTQENTARYFILMYLDSHLQLVLLAGELGGPGHDLHNKNCIQRGPEHDLYKENCSGVLGKTPSEKTARRIRRKAVDFFFFIEIKCLYFALFSMAAAAHAGCTTPPRCPN